MSDKKVQVPCKNISDMVGSLQKNNLASALLVVFSGNTMGSSEKIKSAIQLELAGVTATNFLDKAMDDPKLIEKLKKHYEGNALANRLLDSKKLVWMSKKLGLDENQSLLKNYVCADEITKNNIDVLFPLRSMGEFGEKGFPQTDAPAFDVDNHFCVIRKDEIGKFEQIFRSKMSYMHNDEHENNYGPTEFGAEGVMQNEFKVQSYDQKKYGSSRAGIIRLEDNTNYVEVYFADDCSHIMPFGFGGDQNEALLKCWLYTNIFPSIVRRFPDGRYEKVTGDVSYDNFSDFGHRNLPKDELIARKGSSSQETILKKTSEGYQKMFVIDTTACDISDFGAGAMEENELLRRHYSAGERHRITILRRCKDGTYKYVLNSWHIPQNKFGNGWYRFKDICKLGKGKKGITLEVHRGSLNKYLMVLDENENYVMEKQVYEEFENQTKKQAVGAVCNK